MKNKKKICIIGHFGEGYTLLNGQTIKTKVVTNYLKCRFGENKITQVDTHGGKKALITIISKIFLAVKNCNDIIILPAQNGVKIIAPILWISNILFSRKLHYVVIGGWLPELIKNNHLLKIILKKYDFIYVETSVMEESLKRQGFNNIVIMPNCKELNIVEESELVFSTHEPYKLCIFSRVMIEKGIEDAVTCVKKVNEYYGRNVYELDIYGDVESGQEGWFNHLRKDFPDYIKYKGSVSYEKSADVLKEYYALLFPTRFFTEGIPGTIIDAYAAGIPVICSNWESCKDIVDDEKTGRIFEFGNNEACIQLLKNFVTEPKQLNDIKINCLSKAKEYLPKKVLNNLAEKLG